MEDKKGKTALIFAITCMIWGSTWLVIRVGLESLTPLVSAGFRFTLASLIIFIITRLRKVDIQTDKASVKLYLLMAFLSFTIPFGLIYWAEQFVPSGLAAVLFAIYPFAIAIISYFRMPDEEIGIFKVIGMIISFMGIIVIFSDSFNQGITDYFWGMGAVLLGSVMQAFVGVSIKKHGHHLNPLAMNFFPMLICGISLLIYGSLVEDTTTLHFDSKAILSVLYLAVFGSIVTFTSYYWLLKRVNIVILSLIAFITPVLAVILGAIIYNEVFSLRHILGSCMVLAGLLFAIFGNVNKYFNRQTQNG